MKKSYLFSLYDEKREATTKLMVELPLDTPIVFTEVNTSFGKRFGFKKYKKWYQFWE